MYLALPWASLVVRCVSVDLVDGVTDVKLVADTLVPGLVGLRIRKFILNRLGSFVSQFVGRLNIRQRNRLAIVVFVSEVADCEGKGARGCLNHLGNESFDHDFFRLGQVIFVDVALSKDPAPDRLFEEVPRVAGQQVVLRKDILRLVAINEELESHGWGVPGGAVIKEVDI